MLFQSQTINVRHNSAMFEILSTFLSVSKESDFTFSSERGFRKCCCPCRLCHSESRSFPELFKATANPVSQIVDCYLLSGNSPAVAKKQDCVHGTSQIRSKLLRGRIMMRYWQLKSYRE